MALLKLKDIGKIYVSEGNVVVGIRGINLNFERGEFVAITGESGSGKSTLLNVISGMDTYEEGELYINNEATSHYIQPDWEEYRKENISFTDESLDIIAKSADGSARDGLSLLDQSIVLSNGDIKTDIVKKMLGLADRTQTLSLFENLVKKYASRVTTLKKITPHKLRSTFGTSLYRETGDIYMVADFLGHSDINTTKKHYAAITEENRRRVANAVKLRKDSPFEEE